MSSIQRWMENEDWVEFVSRDGLTSAGTGAYEAVLNFGGPMSRTRYHVYARVRQGHEDVIKSVQLEGEEFEEARLVASVPGTPEGMMWIYLGSAQSCRAYRKMTIIAPAGLDGLDRICILQIPRRLETGVIERGIAREQAGNPEPVSGVPLGGVGAGKLEICADGLFRNITINGNIDAPIRLSDGTFFAVRAETYQGASGRIIATEELHGLPCFSKLEFDGSYPTARLEADDPDFPIAVEIGATGPIIPRNVKDSALPLALFAVKLTAKDLPAQASAVFCAENLLGCGGGLSPGLTERGTLSEGFYEIWEERAGNSESSWDSGDYHGLLFDGGEKQEKRSQGQYVLATDAPVSSHLVGWRLDDSADAWTGFFKNGRFPENAAASSSGERTAGGVAVDVDLQPGETREVRFIFAWHVPVFQQSPVAEYGHYYSNFFNDAGEVAVYGLQNFDRLRSEAAEVPDLLRSSSLPGWFARSLANDAFVFSTGTWLTRDGRFAVNEGPTHMFGCMGTLDQKLYANHYYSLFFPELDRTELLGFARAQARNGGLRHDLGAGHIEMRGKHCQWPDLVCGFAILSLKHYQLTGDQDYIDEVYPRIVQAVLDYLPGMDHDNDGLADGPEVGNTFDAEHFEGVNCYTATLTLAALKVLENLATRRGDNDTAARCREWFEKARQSAFRLLWNDRYFISFNNAAGGKVNGNCHISQLAGEFFSRLCGLGPLYGDEYSREALQWIQRLNANPELVFPTNEATPEGRPPSRQMWGWLPHVRVFVGGLPFFFGAQEKGMRELERMDRVIGELNNENRWDLRLFYEPDTGRQHWGRFYMSAPATWLVYQAALGFLWDKPAGLLAVVPNVSRNMLPLSAPVFTPGFWLWMELSEDHAEMRLQVIKRFEHDLAVRTLRVPAGSGEAVVYADGAPVEVHNRHTRPESDCEELEVDIDLGSVNEINVVRR